jgi:hypothetical protein
MKDVLFFHRFKARTHKSKVDRDKDGMGKTQSERARVRKEGKEG